MPLAKFHTAKIVATRDGPDEDGTDEDVLDYGSLVFATPNLTDEDRANVSAVVFSVDTWKMDKNFTASNYEEEPLDFDWKFTVLQSCVSSTPGCKIIRQTRLTTPPDET